MHLLTNLKLMLQLLKHTTIFKETLMSKYHEKFIKALRDVLPISKHPNKELYTLEQLRALFTPDMVPINCGQYGAAQCICGHDIKYAYQVIYKYDPKIKVSPIGSECINTFFDPSEVYLKTIIDSIDLKRLWNGKYTTKNFCKANGFTSNTMNYLDMYVLTKSEFAFLQSIVKARSERHFTEKQIRFMYHIIKRIQEEYAELKQRQYALECLDDNGMLLF